LHFKDLLILKKSIQIGFSVKWQRFSIGDYNGFLFARYNWVSPSTMP
jgi:hypothetical protein